MFSVIVIENLIINLVYDVYIIYNINLKYVLQILVRKFYQLNFGGIIF